MSELSATIQRTLGRRVPVSARPPHPSKPHPPMSDMQISRTIARRASATTSPVCSLTVSPIPCGTFALASCAASSSSASSGGSSPLREKRGRSLSPLENECRADDYLSSKASKSHPMCSPASFCPTVHPDASSLDALATAASYISSGDSPSSSPVPGLSRLSASASSSSSSASPHSDGSLSSNASSPTPPAVTTSPPLASRRSASDVGCFCRECFPIASLPADMLIERIIRLLSKLAQTAECAADLKSLESSARVFQSLRGADAQTKLKLPSLVKDFILHFGKVKSSRTCSRRLTSPHVSGRWLEDSPRNEAYNPANRALTKALASESVNTTARSKMAWSSSKTDSLSVSASASASPSSSLRSSPIDAVQNRYLTNRANSNHLLSAYNISNSTPGTLFA